MSKPNDSYVLPPVDTKGQDVTFSVILLDEDGNRRAGGASCDTLEQAQVALIERAGQSPSIVVSIFFHEACTEWVVGVFGKEVDEQVLFELVDA